MRCPGCDKVMLILEFQEVEIDFCESCQSIWLDHGELDIIAGLPPTQSTELELVKKRGGKRRCPRCQSKMPIGTFPQSEVELDYCRKGDGILFDQGELQSVLKEGGMSGQADKLDDFFRSFFEYEADESEE